MKKFKIIDFRLSVILIIGFVFFGFVTRDGKFIHGYFIVGGWQMVSMIIHLANQWFTERGNLRYRYQKLVFWFVLIFTLLIGLGWFVEETTWTPFLIASFSILYLTPFMAFFYTYICYEETFIKMKRPMELLK